MDILHKQKQPWGCGMYSVAHALNLPSFVTDERLADSKEFGNTNGQLNDWLKQDGKDFYIEPIYYNAYAKRLPFDVCKTHIVDTAPDSKILALPVMINVRYGPNSLNHLIGAQIDRQGLIHVHDSLTDEVKVTVISKLNRFYHEVYGLWCFCNNQGHYVFIHQ